MRRGRVHTSSFLILTILGEYLMRSTVHYLYAFIILVLYGGQVCPFVDALDIKMWAAELAVVLGGLGYIRYRREKTIAVSSSITLVQRQFYFDILLLLAGGVGVTLFNTWMYRFPIESGLKVFIGFAIFSFYISVDLALEKEREVIHWVKTGVNTISLSKKFMPLTRKFSIVAAVTAFSTIIVLFLVFSKDLDWLLTLKVSDIPAARGIVLGEVTFVVLVLLSLIFNLIYSYTKNLKIFISNENGALKDVTRGKLDSHVPVGSQDEFGVMADYTNQMIERLKERTVELLRTQDVAIFSLASLAEIRDPETGAHIMRTQRYVKVLAEYLAKQGEEELTPQVVELLFKSAPLHDIGKVGIPDHILLKPGRLNAEEFEIMKKHAIYGWDSLCKSEKILGSNSFLKYAKEISKYHHEKWDGSGYPTGLKGEEIPLSARLMALADVYDALISKRVYKEAFSHEKARTIILEGNGKHFDPNVVSAFCEMEEQFITIAAEYGDEVDPYENKE